MTGAWVSWWLHKRRARADMMAVFIVSSMGDHTGSTYSINDLKWLRDRGERDEEEEEM